MKIEKESIASTNMETGKVIEIPAPVNNETDCWTEFVHGHLIAIKGTLDCLIDHVEGTQE